MSISESLAESGRERRADTRMDRELEIEISVAKYQERLVTGNVSSSGVFLRGDASVNKLLLRTIVKLKLVEGKDADIVLGRVVWINENGIGIEFIDKNDSTKFLKD